MTSAETSTGQCHDDFSLVEEEFRRNFESRGELGAAVAVYIGGDLVVDLWGGSMDGERSRPWERDTLVPIMSATKGATSLCAHLLVIDGRLDFDAPVAEYWPEYAVNGKEGTLVRHVLTHQAGLPALREPLPPGAFYDWDGMVARLAAEAPFWEPGTAYGYHGLTFGYLVGELVRRVAGVSIGTFLATEVAAPLGIDLFIGLPEDEYERVANLYAPVPVAGERLSRYAELVLTDPTSLAHLMTVNCGGYLVPGEWDSLAALTSEMPSVGGVGNARSLATMYRAIAWDRQVGRFPIGTDDLAAMSYTRSFLGQDQVLQAPGHWTYGFQKAGGTPKGAEPAARVVLGPDAFGHTGMGGSISFADPSCNLSFAYTMNQMAQDMGLGPTGQSLVDAAYRSLGFEPSRHGDLWVRETVR